MKRILLICIVLPFLSCGVGLQVTSTEIPPIEENLSFDLDQEELFILSNLWFEKEYSGSKPILQKRNESAGEIEGMVRIGGFKYSSTSVYSSNYNMADNPIKVLVNLNLKDKGINIVVSPEPYSKMESKYYATTGLDSEQKINEEVSIMISDFNNFIKNNRLITTNNAPRERVVNLEGTKNELFVRTNKWVVENFKSAKSVIQFSDKEGGVVAGRYLLGENTFFEDAEESSKKDVFALMTIDLKDNAAKISLIPQEFQYVKNSLTNNFGLTKEKMDEQLTALIDSFEDYLNNYTSKF
jgi:hypothetical protein